MGTNVLAQTLAVTAMTLRAARERLGSSMVSIIGIAGVVMIFVGVLSISEGFRKTLELAGSDRVAVVLRGGTTSELASSFTPEQTEIIASAPGVERQNESGPVVSAELFTAVDQPKRTTGTPANAPLRGIGPAGTRTREHFRLVAGRMFETGRNEVIVGRGAAGTLRGLDLGTTLKWGNNTWKVVGIFTDGGSVAESEIWTDSRVLQSAYALGGTFQTVRARLASPGDFKQFKDRLTADPRLNVTVLTEKQFYAEQSSTLTALLRSAGTILGLLMGVGAVFGAVNTMYSAVAARTSEIATLRALGFGGVPVLVSVMTESALLGLVGGVVGAAIAYVCFDGFQTSTLNYASFSQVSFAFSVTPALLVTAIGYALLLGLAGGLLPALHAVRQPVVEGLRAT
ncbi:MAG: ABC transporter permease [Gammaproteobacteria bacterium]